MGGIDFSRRRRDHLLTLPNMDVRLFLWPLDLRCFGAFFAPIPEAGELVGESICL
jgi:hypothetical protein